MRTGRVAVVAVAVLLTGCSGPIPGGGTVTGTTATPTTTGVVCPPNADFDQRDLPPPPATRTSDTVTAYVAESENTTRWNDLVADPVIHASTDIEDSRVVNETRDGFVVDVDGRMSIQACSNRGGAVPQVVTGHGPWAARYFITETHSVRLEANVGTRADIVANGTVVERWGTESPSGWVSPSKPFK